MTRGAAAAVLLMAAAAPPAGSAPDGAAAVRLEVPFVPQAPERCGPAALAMVLRYLGVPAEEPEVAAAIHSRALRGALITDLAGYARSRGLAARVRPAAAAALDSMLRRGAPAILLLDAGLGPLRRGHFAVLYGSDPGNGRYLLHSGRDSARWIRADLLGRRWRRGGGLLLEVARP